MGDARLDQIDAEVAKTKQGVAQAISSVIERGDKLEALDDKADNIKDRSAVFYQSSHVLQKRMCMDKWKTYGFVLLCVGFLALILYFILK